MWAMLDDDNKTVIAVFPPSISYNDLTTDANGKTLVLMHQDNSPGYLNGTYVKGKFYQPGEKE